MGKDQVKNTIKICLDDASSEYEKISGPAKFISYLLPNRWTKAGKLRSEINFYNNSMKMQTTLALFDDEELEDETKKYIEENKYVEDEPKEKTNEKEKSNELDNKNEDIKDANKEEKSISNKNKNLNKGKENKVADNNNYRKNVPSFISPRKNPDQDIYNISKQYRSFSFRDRLISRILPDRWTEAGNLRLKKNALRRQMAIEARFSHREGKDFDYLKDNKYTRNEKIRWAVRDRAYDKAVSVLTATENQYKKESRFMRFLSYITPKQWTKAGRLRDDINKCKRTLHNCGIERDDIKFYQKINGMNPNELSPEVYAEMDKTMGVPNKDVSIENKPIL